MKFLSVEQLDLRILTRIRECIDAQAWDLVDEELNQFIDMIKAHLLKIHKENKKWNIDMLVECENVSDLLHTKGWVDVSYIEPFRNCLLSIYAIKECLLYGQPFTDEDQIKKDFQKDIDCLQRYLKEAMLKRSSAFIEKILPGALDDKKTKANRSKGQDAPKSMVSLYACIEEIVLKEGVNVKPEVVRKKLHTFTDDQPYQYKGYKLKYDLEADKFYQRDDKTGIEKNRIGKTVYKYIKAIKENIQKNIK